MCKHVFIRISGLFVILSLILIGCSKHSSESSSETPANTTSSFDMGRELYNAVERTVGSLENGAAKVAIVKQNREQLICSFNQVIPYDKRKEMLGVLDAAVHLIDNKSLPQMTDNLGQIILKLSQDWETVDALVKLIDSKTNLDVDATFNLVGQLLMNSDINKVLQSLSKVVKKNPDVVAATFRLLSNLLSDMEDSEKDPTGKGFSLDLFSDVLSFVDPDLGKVSWGVKMGPCYNPKVRINPKTGTLYEPFVDNNGDQLCDLNDRGIPIDKNNTEINIPAFSGEGYVGDNVIIYRDEDGKAISAQKDEIFEYYDTKKVPFSCILRILAELIDKDVHRDLNKVCLAGLGDPGRSGRGYSPDNPIHKIAQEVLTLLKSKHLPRLFIGLADLLNKHQDVAEKLMIIVGELIKIIQGTQMQDVRDIGPVTINILEKPQSISVLEFQKIMKQYNVPGTDESLWEALLAFLKDELPGLIDNFFMPSIELNNRVKSLYPDDPTLLRRFLVNTIAPFFEIETSAEGYKLKHKMIVPFLACFLKEFARALQDGGSAIIDTWKTKLYNLMVSNDLQEVLRFTTIYLNNSESEVLDQALLMFLRPNLSAEKDAFGSVTKMSVELSQLPIDAQAKVLLLRWVGKTIHPDSNLVKPLIKSVCDIMTYGNSEGLFIFKRAFECKCKCGQCCGRSPVCIIVKVIRNIWNYGSSEKKDDTSVADTRETLVTISNFLCDSDGLLNKLYRLVRTRPK